MRPSEESIRCPASLTRSPSTSPAAASASPRTSSGAARPSSSATAFPISPSAGATSSPRSRPRLPRHRTGPARLRRQQRAARARSLRPDRADRRPGRAARRARDRAGLLRRARLGRLRGLGDAGAAPEPRARRRGAVYALHGLPERGHAPGGGGRRGEAPVRRVVPGAGHAEAEMDAKVRPILTRIFRTGAPLEEVVRHALVDGKLDMNPFHDPEALAGARRAARRARRPRSLLPRLRAHGLSRRDQLVSQHRSQRGRAPGRSAPGRSTCPA